MPERTEKVAKFIKEQSAQFLERENNSNALITVTGATVSPDLRNATVLITVMPEEKEEKLLQYLKSRRSDLRNTLKKNMQTKVVPFIEIEVDQGEKNRQKIDELLRNG